MRSATESPVSYPESEQIVMDMRESCQTDEAFIDWAGGLLVELAREVQRMGWTLDEVCHVGLGDYRP